jgi:glycosyltransferase involved in cell wall biosynthesis
LVLWLHDRHGSGGVLEYLARRTPPDFALLNSRWSAEGMPGFLPQVPHQILYCPVEGDRLGAKQRRSELRRQFQTPDDVNVILQVGRWEPHKGHLSHLAALGRIRELKDWVCWQVGAPQRASEQAYFAQVRELADRLQIADRLRFLGWQPDLAEVRAAADIYCQPNTQPEPFGLTLVEALSAGLPVVASAEAGPLEIIVSDCGVLVPPGDVESLAAGLRRLLTDLERSRLSDVRQRRAAEMCDPRQQVRRLAQCLADRCKTSCLRDDCCPKNHSDPS